VSSAHPPETLGSPAQRDRRRRILDAAIGLASQGGFEAVQMRAVAERADVALGTLYRYFPSKIHLLVSALGREFERADARLRETPISGGDVADRVGRLLRRNTRAMQDDPHLTEALTRAFVFADASAQPEIQVVQALMTSMLTRAMRPATSGVTDEDVATAEVIGDVWLSAMVGWVTGRNTADEAGRRIEVAVRLLLR
jgi:AcrR family transcriptional regulator